MYNQELQCEILHLLKEKSIKEVSEQFNISCSTLYRWQKMKNDSKLIRKLISEEKYEEALEIIKNYSNNEVIQSQLMTIYIENGEYEKAIAIAKKYLDNEMIQNQLITIYIEKWINYQP